MSLPTNRRVSRKQLLRAGIVILLVIVLAALAILIYRFAPRAGKRAEIAATLDQVQAQWAAHPIAHYRLTLKYAGTLWAGPGYVECLQDVEVVGETTGTVYRDSCQNVTVKIYFVSQVTVSGLFARLKTDMSTLGSVEDMYCHGVLIVTVSYDETLHYPTRVVYTREAVSPDTIGSEAYWQRYGDPGKGYTCLAYGLAVPPTITVSLQPLS